MQDRAELVPQETGCMIQYAEGIRDLFILTQYRDMYFCVGHVTRDLHGRDTDHPEPRVPEFIVYQCRQFTLDLFADTACPWKLPGHQETTRGQAILLQDTGMCG